MAFAKYNAEKIEKALNTERKVYFEGIGKNVQDAHSLEVAISESGLDFEVQKMPIAYMTETVQNLGDGRTLRMPVPHSIKNQFATVRTDTGEALGIVGKNYEILQNQEAFDFLDGLVGDAKFETAGSYGGTGAKSFITMSTEPMQILGDDFMPYILFMNTFDGTGAVRVMFTPVRVFCSNCLAMAIKNAQNKLSIRHSTHMKSRLETAKYVLTQNTNYFKALKEISERLAVKPFSENAFLEFARQQYPVNAEDKEFVQVRNMAMVEALMKAYREHDLDNYKNTAYRAVQAVADFESHKPTFRNNEGLAYRNITQVIAGMPLMNLITQHVLEAA